jgi:flavin-dependent dehydrogenase
VRLCFALFHGIAMKPVTIVGGGLAGLRLGIGLREHGVPVTIYEAGYYPRHRVCGEFISGAGQRTIEQLGIATQKAQTAAFFSGPDKCWQFDLPQPALCISRYDLDKALADTFCAGGGKLMCGTRVHLSGEGTIHATGRRLHPIENGWRWFGLKAHAMGIELKADLEMHLVPSGYIGLCRLPGGRINACGLFRKRAGENGRVTLADSLGPRFKHARWIEGTHTAVSGLCFCAPQTAGQGVESRTPVPEPHIGDANAMIAPLTGNGMSMAFESAEAAVEPLLRHARGDQNWREAVQEIHDALSGFRVRLDWGKRLQWAAFHPWLLSFCARAGLPKLLFAATR